MRTKASFIKTSILKGGGEHDEEKAFLHRLTKQQQCLLSEHSMQYKQMDSHYRVGRL